MESMNSTIQTAVAVLVPVFTALYYMVTRLSKLELKVETLWDFQLRRGLFEGLDKDLLVKNSPIRITEKAKEVFRPLTPLLKDFCSKIKATVSDSDLTLLIEKEFGPVIVKSICVPLGLNHSSCLIIAAAIGRGKDEISVDITGLGEKSPQTA